MYSIKPKKEDQIAPDRLHYHQFHPRFETTRSTDEARRDEGRLSTRTGNQESHLEFILTSVAMSGKSSAELIAFGWLTLYVSSADALYGLYADSLFESTRHHRQ